MQLRGKVDNFKMQLNSVFLELSKTKYLILIQELDKGFLHLL